MAEETAAAQADATQADAQASQSQADATGAQDGDGDTLTREDASKLKSESRNLRTRLRDAEAKVAEHEKQSLTDAERRDRDLDETRTENARLKGELRSARVERVATKLGFIDPEDASALIGELADDADEKQIRKQLAELLSRKPHLAASGNGADGGEGRHAGSRPQSMNDLILAAGRRS